MGKINTVEQVMEICDLYRSGLTLVVIGERFGVSRTWVGEILRCNNVTYRDTERGKKKDAKAKNISAEKGKRFEARARRLGMSSEELAGHLKKYGCGVGSPLQKFRSQRNQAGQRGIAWSFSFGEWWRVWERSKKWKVRGRSGYVMARFGDVGSYSADNVYICTSSKNIKDSYVNKPWHERASSNMAGRRKIAESEYEAIRQDTRGRAVIAEQYGVHIGTIHNIKRSRPRRC